MHLAIDSHNMNKTQMCSTTYSLNSINYHSITEAFLDDVSYNYKKHVPLCMC